MNTTAALFRTRRFAPLFCAQFLGGFNDNFFRQAMALLIAYRLSAGSGLDVASLTALAAATFVAPFVLLSAFAGQLADTLDKALIARRLKALEIGLMVLAAFALIGESMAGLFAVLFLTGAQSALFGPVKYSLLPTHLRDDELVQGNALIEGGTFLAILIGSLLGGALIGTDTGISVVAVSLCFLATLGWLAARKIPPAPPVATGLRPSFNLVAGTRDLIAAAHGIRPVWLSILGISWFWTIGSVMLSLVPVIAKDHFGAAESLASAFLGVFSIGIAVGSLLCARLLKGEITARYVPFAALAITALLLALAALLAALPVPAAQGLGLADTVPTPGGLSVVAVLFLLASAAGFYVVPLFAILQHEAPAEAKARMIGANNVINALMMVAGSVATIALSSLVGLSTAGIIVVFAVLNLLAAGIALRLLSRDVLRMLARLLLGTVFRVELRGLENLARSGDRRIVIANHSSFLDGALLAAYMPGDPVFAVDTFIARRWWSRPLLSLVDFVTVDPTNPLALKTLVREVERGRPLVIFPEGRLTITGSLMKVYDGPAMVAERTGAEIVPVRLDGLQHTWFTRLEGRLPRRLAPKVTLTALPPRRLDIAGDRRGRARRHEAGQQLYDLMSEMLFRTTDIDRTLFRSLIDAARLNGRGHEIVEDIDYKPLTYGRILAGAFVLGRKLKPLALGEAPVGILLPNSAGCLVSVFALHAIGRVPALLNPSTGARGMAAACRAAGVSKVLTARRFVARAKLDDVVEALGREVEIVYLDDVRSSIGRLDKLRGLLASYLPDLFYRDTDAASPAVVLFTSGSEGAPKGVVLSHRSIQANRHQVGARIAFNAQDVVFNALPMFHSFGLTVATFLPVLAGIRTFLYPSPLHYRIVPELVYQTDATVFFGTDTFLRGYARVANPYDFQSVRLIGAGAERVGEATRRIWNDKFGIRILEGYGATETAPVIAFNTPMHFKAGTVGRLMPGMQARLEPVPGIDEGGRLLVKGPNVMLGYLRETAPGVIETVEGGWYDTGDIVAIDAEGFLTIKGRAKRFAKIAGEMVSLAAVEEFAGTVSPDHRHAAIARPDARKGEQIVLVSDDEHMTRARFQAAAARAGMPEIMHPRLVRHVASIPVLGTGKTDHAALAACLESEQEAETA